MTQGAGGRVELVWYKGIAALCDRRFPDEFPDGITYSPVPVYAGALWSSRLPENLISNPSIGTRIHEGDLVWVRLSWLKSFVRQILPRVPSNFILLTGDSDTSVPAEIGPIAREILNCDRVLHWYTQNHDGSMPQERISPLPIGIDFHTLSERRFWGENVSSPLEQEQLLVSIAQRLPGVPYRIRKVYADFAWQRGFGMVHHRRYHPLQGTAFHEDRRQVTKRLRKNNLVYCQNSSLPRREMWRRRGEYAFVVSPHGMGLDCLRTWESLALGHIVLVPSSSLDPLFANLPVIPVRSWDEITPENLEKWISRYPRGASDHPKLRTSYWVDEMRASTQETAPRSLVTPESFAANCGGSTSGMAGAFSKRAGDV